MKDTLFRWVTGTLKNETGNNTPYLENAIDTPTNFKDNLEAIVGTITFVSNTIQIGDTNLIGGRANGIGFLCLYDNNFNIIYATNKLFNGSNLERIMFLTYENNQILAISGETAKNLIVFNDFTITTNDEYYISIINSIELFIPVELSENFKFLSKNPEKEEYLIIAEYNELNRNRIIGTKITIDETIIRKNFIDSETQGNLFFDSAFMQWEEFQLYVSGVVGTQSGASTYLAKIWQLNADETSLIEYYTYTEILDNRTPKPVLNFNTFDDLYILSVNTNENNKLEIIRLTNFVSKTIFQLELNENVVFNDLKKVGDILFFRIITSLNKVINGFIINDQVIYDYAFFGSIDYSLINIWLITKENNLYSILSQFEKILVSQKLSYANDKFNGLPFENNTSLIPSSGKLRSRNDLVYDEKIYNKIIQNNVTTSILKIDNTKLNGINISLEELIGLTNKTILSDNVVFQKNIFEELFINFISLINIKNENTNQIISNINGASILNNSISNLANYDDTKMTKYKINYLDGTTKINNLAIPEIIGNIANYTITIFNNNINNIELISNDENLSYITIDLTSYENNKFYAIKQKMEVI